MLRASFFLKFFKYKQNSGHGIVQYKSNESFTFQEQINTKIIELDQKIAEISKAIIEAQIVKFRSTFSRSNGFIEKIRQDIYKTKSEDSIHWHQKQLKDLYIKRKELRMSLEKLQGIFWLNQFKRLLRIILIGVFVFLSLFIFLYGFMIITSLLPFILLIGLGYMITYKRY